MRINTRVVFDIKLLCVVQRESFEYNGSVAICKGGGGAVDKKYNRRMANVAERQQNIADQYFKFWETTQKPYEMAQVKANVELMPFEVEQRKVGLQTRTEEMQKAAPVVEEYYKQALEGVDIGEETARARADVTQGLHEVEGEMERHMGRLGIDPTSPAYMERMKTSGMEKAKAVGGAMSAARTQAKTRSFGMLSEATQVSKAGINY